MGGLEPGRRYAFRCSAINAQGSSGWGPVTQLDTLPGLPFPVDCLNLAATTSTSLRVHWSQPYGQGSPVTGYVLELAQAAALEQHAGGGEEDDLFSPAHQGPECSATGVPAELLCMSLPWLGLSTFFCCCADACLPVLVYIQAACLNFSFSIILRPP